MFVTSGSFSTTIKEINPDRTITLNAPAPAGQNTYTFKGAVSDYVAERMMALWFAWADYYVETITARNPFGGGTQGTLTGSIGNGQRTLQLQATDQQVAVLEIGMVVSGAGIQDKTIIAGFGTTATGAIDKKIVHLNLVSNFVGQPPPSAPYTFKLPESINRLSSIVPLSKLTISAADQATKTRADKFAAVVYEVMRTMSTVPQQSTGLPGSAIDLMINAIGFLFGFSDASVGTGQVRKDIEADLRDDVKSILRGVSNFRAPDESEASGNWYPNPAEVIPAATFTIDGRETAKFNVFNLDPYVWFIHSKLNISSYAFSVDDDKADVQSRDATHLQVAIGGLTGLDRKSEWTFGAPYGAVGGPGTLVPGTPANPTNPDKIKSLPEFDVWRRLGFPSVVEGNFGAYVNGPGVLPDTRVVSLAEADGNDQFIVVLDKFLDRAALVSGPTTYTFFGHVHATGTIDPVGAPTTITGLSQEVIDELMRITANGTIGAGPDGKMRNGALVVRGAGIPTNRPLTRILSINSATRSVELDQPLDPAAPMGEFVNGFTFF
jgi:hypothetical protein